MTPIEDNSASGLITTIVSRIEAKLDDQSNKLSHVDRTGAMLQAQVGDLGRNSNRIESALITMSSTVTDLSMRVTALESRLGRDHEERIRVLEHSRAKLAGMAAAAAAIATSALQWILSTL